MFVRVHLQDYETRSHAMVTFGFLKKTASFYVKNQIVNELFS